MNRRPSLVPGACGTAHGQYARSQELLPRRRDGTSHDRETKQRLDLEERRNATLYSSNEKRNKLHFEGIIREGRSVKIEQKNKHTARLFREEFPIDHSAEDGELDENDDDQ